MDVFVIPIGRDRYELYCEASTDGDVVESVPPTGLLGRLRYRFGAMLRTVDQEQHHGGDGHAASDGAPPRSGLLTGLKGLILKKIARRIADQRLLWNLRRQTVVVAAHPPDMTFEQVLALIHRMLRRDFERHRVRFAVYLVGLVASGLLAPFPGPNVLAYYFAFRVVGHWLSMRGATQGLSRISWSGRPCQALTDLRDVTTLEPRARDARISEVAGRLHLSHLTSLFRRADVRPVIDSSPQS
jgi:hypothetical protein